VCILYSLAGVMLLLLPAASEHSIVVGFIVLTLVIVFSLAPNGALLAMASSGGAGPAMPLNLAVVRACLQVARFTFCCVCSGLCLARSFAAEQNRHTVALLG
jgi:hypothetical protein